MGRCQPAWPSEEHHILKLFLVAFPIYKLNNVSTVCNIFKFSKKKIKTVGMPIYENEVPGINTRLLFSDGIQGCFGALIFRGKIRDNKILQAKTARIIYKE